MVQGCERVFERPLIRSGPPSPAAVLSEQSFGSGPVRGKAGEKGDGAGRLRHVASLFALALSDEHRSIARTEISHLKAGELAKAGPCHKRGCDEILKRAFAHFQQLLLFACSEKANPRGCRSAKRFDPAPCGVVLCKAVLSSPSQRRLEQGERTVRGVSAPPDCFRVGGVEPAHLDLDGSLRDLAELRRDVGAGARPRIVGRLHTVRLARIEIPAQHAFHGQGRGGGLDAHSHRLGPGPFASLLG